jgi:hypothetical protein
MNQLNNKSVSELIAIYSSILKELKRREVIRTNNLVGDLGEYLAIEFYNNQPLLPNLQAAPAGTKNIDAISREGKRYSIKSTTTSLTGVVYDLNEPDSTEPESQKFEYMIVIQFSKTFELLRVIELDWEIFLQFKRWHKTMRGWNINITKDLLNQSNVLLNQTK